MKPEKIDKVFQIFSDKNPFPETELEYKNHFTLAVAVALSAQSTDVSVNKATKDLFLEIDTPEKMLALGEHGLKEYIKTIGLYNSKAKNIMGMSKMLIEKHQSIMPDNFEELILLPGVGNKTANVILNCAFGKLTMPVDTHVYRVSHRIGFSKGKNPDLVEKDLLKIIPKKWMKYAHHWLILHGRYVCKARNPLCGQCDIAKYCKYYASIC